MTTELNQTLRRFPFIPGPLGGEPREYAERRATCPFGKVRLREHRRNAETSINALAVAAAPPGPLAVAAAPPGPVPGDHGWIPCLARITGPVNAAGYSPLNCMKVAPCTLFCAGCHSHTYGEFTPKGIVS